MIIWHTKCAEIMNSKENDCSRINIHNSYFNWLWSELETGGGVITDKFSTCEMTVNEYKNSKIPPPPPPQKCGRLHQFGKIVHMAYGKKLTKLQNLSNDRANQSILFKLPTWSSCENFVTGILHFHDYASDKKW